MSGTPSTPLSMGGGAAAEDDGDRTGPIGPGGGPDPLDALRAELALIAQQPVGDRVARFEHANVVLAAALAELDEV